MRRIPYYADLPDEARAEVLRELGQRGIRCNETAPTLFSRVGAWVDDADFTAASEITRSIDRRYAEQARLAWEAEWRGTWRGSYLRWLLGRLRDPGNWLRLALLAALLALCVGYPLAVLLRGG